jgi:DNA-binding NtrC family response regulator
MPQGGDLKFTAQNIQIDRNEGKTPHNLTAGDYVALAIQDTGIGIPADHDQSKRIMVIEDDPEVLEVITMTLNNMGYEVIEGGDGSNAINIALAQDSNIDLLLTDVVLPNGINGPDMADAIIQIWGNMKVLLMSGYAQSEILRTTNEDLRYPLIQKPFPMEKLRKKVNDILTKRVK